MSRYQTQDPQSATVKFSFLSVSQAVPCFYEEMRGKRLIIQADQELPTSQAVTVEYNDALFLGETVCCYAAVNGFWKVEIKVEQVLSGLESLIALRARLLCENVAQPSQTVLASVTR